MTVRSTECVHYSYTKIPSYQTIKFVRTLVFQKNCYFIFACLIESPFEMMQNAFYFILKALFVL